MHHPRHARAFGSAGSGHARSRRWPKCRCRGYLVRLAQRAEARRLFVLFYVLVWNEESSWPDANAWQFPCANETTDARHAVVPTLGNLFDGERRGRGEGWHHAISQRVWARLTDTACVERSRKLIVNAVVARNPKRRREQLRRRVGECSVTFAKIAPKH